MTEADAEAPDESAAVDAEDLEADADETDESAAVDGDEPDEQPEMTADEMADFGDVAAEIEGGTTETADETDSTDDSGETDTDEPETEAGGPDVSLGRVYTNALGMGAAVSRTRFGSADEDERDDLADEYADLARQIELDDYVDTWMAESGGLESLSPGQAVLIGTLMWGGMIMMEDPEMAANMADGADVPGVDL
jgi:hypothetical protein